MRSVPKIQACGIRFFVLFPSFLTLGCGRQAETKKQPSQALASHSYSVHHRHIRYLSIGLAAKKAKKALVIFVHGSPGSWKAYEAYLQNPLLQEAASMISVDRIGYGASTKDQAERSMMEQAKLLSPLLDLPEKGMPVLLVGHSLGATIIVRMAMDYPAKVQGLLLIAGALDPALEEPAWYNRLAELSVVRWILPRSIQISNDELIGLKAELEKMLPLWSKIQSPISIIHGLEDSLVSPKNVAFVKEQYKKIQGRQKQSFPLRIIESADDGHFILWQNKKLISKELLHLIDRIGMRRKSAW